MPSFHRNTGRPSKLVPEKTEKILAALRGGNYIETAAALADVSKDCVFEWLRRGAREKRGKFHEFSVAVQKAMAYSEAKDLSVISKAADKGDWKASAWRLSKRHGDRWGERETVRIGGEPGRPVEVRTDVSATLRAKLERLLAEKKGDEE